MCSTCIHFCRFQKEWAELHEASRECAAKAQVCNLDCLCTIHLSSKHMWDKLYWTLFSQLGSTTIGQGKEGSGLMAPLHFCGFIHVYILI